MFSSLKSRLAEQNRQCSVGVGTNPAVCCPCTPPECNAAHSALCGVWGKGAALLCTPGTGMGFGGGILRWVGGVLWFTQVSIFLCWGGVEIGLGCTLCPMESSLCAGRRWRDARTGFGCAALGWAAHPCCRAVGWSHPCCAGLKGLWGFYESVLLGWMIRRGARQYLRAGSIPTCWNGESQIHAHIASKLSGTPFCSWKRGQGAVAEAKPHPGHGTPVGCKETLGGELLQQLPKILLPPCGRMDGRRPRFHPTSGDDQGQSGAEQCDPRAAPNSAFPLADGVDRTSTI